MNLKKLAGKFPNDDRLITSMAITMALRKLNQVKATNAFEASIIYSRHFQVDLPCHGVPSRVGSPNILQCWGTVGTRGLRTYNMFGSKMYKLRNPHTLRWPDTVVTDGLCYSVDDTLSL